jgi:hypothetical protein
MVNNSTHINKTNNYGTYLSPPFSTGNNFIFCSSQNLLYQRNISTKFSSIWLSTFSGED